MNEAEKTKRKVNWPLTDGDHFLRTLNAVANKLDGFGMGVTLQLGGTIVSGTLINADEYFERLFEALNQAGPVAEGMATAIKTSAQTVIDADKEHFVHLRDAKFLRESEMIPEVGCLWRTRLSAIDGFCIGMMNAEKEK